MTAREMIQEAKNQGFRPATVADLSDLLENQEPKVINPEGTIIDLKEGVDYTETKEPKQLK